MSVLDLIGIKAGQLPPEMQQEVLNFVEFLNVKKFHKTPEKESFPQLQNVRGAGKGLVAYMADNFDAPLEDLKEYM